MNEISSQPLPKWLEGHFQHWQHQLANEQVPQAMIISGAAGLGKSLLVNHMVTALFQKYSTKSHAHQSSRSTEAFARSTHPDYLEFSPDDIDKAIKLEHIRQLIAFSQLSPQFSGYKVVVIHHAQQMNIASANAFLKTLEEPAHQRVIFILMTSDCRRLLATIRSRCQKFLLAIPTTEQALHGLSDIPYSEIEKQQALFFANDAPLQARVILESGDLSHYIARLQIVHEAITSKKVPLQLSAQWKNLKTSDILMTLYHYVYLQNHPAKQTLFSEQYVAQLENTVIFKLLDFVTQHQRILQHKGQFNLQMMLDGFFLTMENQ